MELRTVSAWSARLDALPRLSLMTDPTPLAFAPHLSATLGGPKLWFKRDDLLPVAFGGNKVRSLDLIVADALRQGADTLVTGAGPLSNHVRASAGVAALAGLRCVAVYWGMEPVRVEGNHWLTRLLGAEMRFMHDGDRASVDRGIEAAAAESLARPSINVGASVSNRAWSSWPWAVGTALFSAGWRLEAVTVSRPAPEALPGLRNWRPRRPP
jgi:D-cysteine desulfhydrase